MVFYIQTLNFVSLLSIDSLSGRLRNQVVSSLVCDESLTWQYLNSNLGQFICFTFTFVSLENYVCLSRGMQVAGAV
jgi:hypothetical protein